MGRGRIITFKAPEDLLERLDRYAERRGLSRSQVIKDAILALLSAEDALVLGDHDNEDYNTRYNSRGHPGVVLHRRFKSRFLPPNTNYNDSLAPRGVRR